MRSELKKKKKSGGEGRGGSWYSKEVTSSVAEDFRALATNVISVVSSFILLNVIREDIAISNKTKSRKAKSLLRKRMHSGRKVV